MAPVEVYRNGELKAVVGAGEREVFNIGGNEGRVRVIGDKKGGDYQYLSRHADGCSGDDSDRYPTRIKKGEEAEVKKVIKLRGI